MKPSRQTPGLLARTLCRAALALPLLLGAAAAHATSIADVVSSGGSWGGAGNNTWTPTAAGSVVSAAEVNGKLVAASHVKVLTHTADPALVVKAALTLAATSHLELSSHRDIAIQAPVQAGGASVTMRYGQGSVAAGNSATIEVSAPVQLNSSSSYLTNLGSDASASVGHTIIMDVWDLQNMNNDLSGTYVLGADIDASITAGWHGGKGFVPIQYIDLNNDIPFVGTFDGLGHTISALTIDQWGSPFRGGLFGTTRGAILRNVGIRNAMIQGRSRAGALVGRASEGIINNVWVEGGQIKGELSAGGLVGRGDNGLIIRKSYAGVPVESSTDGGGLIGYASDIFISTSYSSGGVTSLNNGINGGGLIGDFQSGSVTNSYATGSVMGFSSSGGLVGSGFGTGTVSNSYYATTDTHGATINNGGATDGVWFYNSYGTAATLSQLQTLFTFTTAGWDIDDAGGTTNAWRIYEGKTTPLLRNLFTDSLTITANSGSKTIDGTTAAFGVSYTPAAPDARLLGTPVAVAASSAAGTHAVNVTGVHSTQRGYDITLVPGTLTINAVVAAPDAPAAPAATPGNAQATVAWTAPASNGGSPITGYTVTGTPGGTCTVAAAAPRTCTIATLANGTPYTFTVKATNAVGDSLPSLASAPVTPTAPVVVAPPAEDPGPTSTTINTPGSTTTITNPSLPVVVGPGAGGGTIVLPGTGTTPVTLQVIVNGKPLTVQALPGTQLRIAEVNGQSVLVLVVLEGWASMTSSAVGQPMVLAGPVLLSAGSAGTLVEAQPLAVAVQVGSLTAPAGSLPAVGSMGLQAGERLQVNDQGAVVAITLGSLKGDANQPGDPMAFANLPASITVDNKAFARLNGALARLSGGNLVQGLEVAPSGVFMVRDGGQVFQLLSTQPITIDARLPDGVGFTPLGLLRWVRSGVVVQFAPAVADLAGLAHAVTAALPDATLKLGAEGVLQLRTGGQAYVLRPDWTGGGTAPGTPQIGVDEQGRIYLQTGQGARQLLLPALLNATQASSIVTTALPGAVLAVQPGSSDGALTLTLAGQAWRLVPQWVLPTGSVAQVPPQAGPWWMGADGLLYLKLGTQVQGVRITD